MNIETVGKVYQQLSKHNLAMLENVYHDDVVFEDAAHTLEGWSALSAYFDSLYSNVTSCDFDITEHQQVGDMGFLVWEMSLKHPKLKAGQLVVVKGVSHLRFSDGKVIYHRDYFDLGEMLYENLPILGAIIRSIKLKLGKS